MTHGAGLYAEVTEEHVQEAVRRILTVGRPLKIVLFGSRARGDARRDSDPDLMIVEESSPLPRYKRTGRFRLALVGDDLARDRVKGS